MVKCCFSCFKREAVVGHQCQECYDDDLDDLNKESQDGES